MQIDPKEKIRFSAGIIAGGYSTRFGQDKALFPVNGQTLLDKQIALVKGLGAKEILVSCRPKQNLPADKDRKLVFDEVETLGPIEGIRCLLGECQTQYLFLLAVDIVALTLPFLQKTLAQVALESGTGFVYSHDGFYEPLCAIYPKSLLPLIKEQIAQGEYSLQKLITQALRAKLVNAAPLLDHEIKFLENMNTKP
ncbi:MAG: molybdenum cofactor guanylyltransferase [Verrucomicrobiota bacterium]|nr:molybdenum cofactor guanylyltransferase [Verrucomicrobiota bacterium]